MLCSWQAFGAMAKIKVEKWERAADGELTEANMKRKLERQVDRPMEFFFLLYSLPET